MKRYVVGFAMSVDMTRVVLIKKKRPMWQAGKLNGVGGKLEPDESLKGSMMREFYEETGVVSCTEDWKLVATLHFPGVTLDVFCTINPIMFKYARTNSDEEIVRVSIGDLSKYDIVENIPELIALCQQYIKGNIRKYEEQKGLFQGM